MYFYYIIYEIPLPSELGSAEQTKRVLGEALILMLYLVVSLQNVELLMITAASIRFIIAPAHARLLSAHCFSRV